MMISWMLSMFRPHDESLLPAALHPHQARNGLGKHWRSSKESKDYDARPTIPSARIKGFHAALWDSGPGEMLSAMMRMAAYTEPSQALHREFFTNSVAFSLGPHPAGSRSGASSWRSFMTDNHTPLELSWSWSATQAKPVVRYSAEPVSWVAGTPSDPLNTRVPVELLRETQHLASSLDLSWYNYFLKALTISAAPDQGLHEDERARTDGALSQTFIAFDLEECGMVVKYYFMPTLKARSSGKSGLELVREAVGGLPGVGRCYQSSIDTVSDYIMSYTEQERPVMEIVAVDCVDPSKARIKIYIRSQKTDFASMLDVMTLGGRTAPLPEGVRAQLAELWCAVFGLESNDKALLAPLPKRHHRTSGLLYYVELKAGLSYPKPKVYLPVRHYAKNDDQIARGLSWFLEKRGKGLAGDSYHEGVTRLCKQRRLEEGLGFHTYITCVVEGDDLAVTSYFNPLVSGEPQLQQQG